MYIGSNQNKSPIENMLHESFDELSNYTQSKGQHEKKFQLHSANKCGVMQQLKFSNGSNHINRQQQLKILKLVSMTQLEIALETLVNVLRNKALNSEMMAINKIKRINSQPNLSSNIHPNHRILIMKRVHLFSEKMNSTVCAKKLRILGNSFSKIYLFNLKTQTQNQAGNINSYIQHLRIQNSHRRGSQCQLDAITNPFNDLVKENKFLKKKKQKIRDCRGDFCNRIDQLLTVHETFLGRI